MLDPVPYRSLIVARSAVENQSSISEIFANSDSTELPELLGIRHRSLFNYNGIYLHYLEGNRDVSSAVEVHRSNELFRQISDDLEPFVRPYDPETWRSPQDAMAAEFYTWSAEG